VRSSKPFSKVSYTSLAHISDDLPLSSHKTFARHLAHQKDAIEDIAYTTNALVEFEIDYHTISHVMDSTDKGRETIDSAARGETVEQIVKTPTYPKNITLDVGGHKFKTSTDTLRAESGFLCHQLSDHST
jgi:hypothetical protein